MLVQEYLAVFIPVSPDIIYHDMMSTIQACFRWQNTYQECEHFFICYISELVPIFPWLLNFVLLNVVGFLFGVVGILCYGGEVMRSDMTRNGSLIK